MLHVHQIFFISRVNTRLMSIITEHFDEHRAMAKGNRPANTAWFSGIVNMSVDRTVGEVI